MEKKVDDVLARLPGRETMILWPLDAVKAIEALRACVLRERLEKELLTVDLREEYEMQIHELMAEINVLRRDRQRIPQTIVAEDGTGCFTCLDGSEARAEHSKGDLRTAFIASGRQYDFLRTDSLQNGCLARNAGGVAENLGEGAPASDSAAARGKALASKKRFVKKQHPEEQGPRVA